MLITIIGVLTSFLAALPAILKRLDLAQHAKHDEGVANATQHTRLLDTVLRPKP